MYPGIVAPLAGRFTKYRFYRFLKNLNLFAQDPEFRDRFELNEAVTKEEGLEILRQIKPQLLEKIKIRPKFTIHKIDHIPEEQVRSFSIETAAMTFIQSKINKADIKLGAFAGDEVVGWIIGTIWNKEGSMSANALFVEENHRHWGIGYELVEELFKETKKKGITHIQFNGMEPGTIKILKRMQKEGLNVTFDEDEDYGYCADVKL